MQKPLLLLQPWALGPVPERCWKGWAAQRALWKSPLCVLKEPCSCEKLFFVFKCYSEIFSLTNWSVKPSSCSSQCPSDHRSLWFSPAVPQTWHTDSLSSTLRTDGAPIILVPRSRSLWLGLFCHTLCFVFFSFSDPGISELIKSLDVLRQLVE